MARWLEQVIHLLPVAPRPDGYNPLGVKNLDPAWIRRLGATGQECFDAIVARDAPALGASMNACMECWEAILPHTVRHPTVMTDLKGILAYYQSRYCGAMYSGCGGGYLFVVSDRARARRVPVQVRIGKLMNAQQQIIVSGGFDDIRSRHLRFLEEAAKLGELNVLLWSDRCSSRSTAGRRSFPWPNGSIFSMPCGMSRG